ncbi:Hypothetical protein A7982_02667 [Minicystis rosea]|nr:Hypothetical protein A7982_02667 [Minicystis rosea]
MMLPRPTPVRSPARFRWIRSVTVVIGFSLLVAGGGLREDELECEQAFAHLKACCPDFDHTEISCVYSTFCNLVLPDLSIPESQCIVQRSCEDIVQGGICERARNRPFESSQTDPEGNAISFPPVCQ